MSVLSAISNDLDWREAEIASMRLLLSSAGHTNGQKKALLRAAWALLYAHYEGFCKNTLTTFYDAISSSGINCNNLPHSTKLFALSNGLRRLKNRTNEELLVEIVNFNSSRLSGSPQFPDVETKSNLWPSVLLDLLKAADVNVEMVSEHATKLKTLVSRRNQIAHGENSIIAEVAYYYTYEAAVYDVMYDLAIQIDNRLCSPPYLAQQEN